MITEKNPTEKAPFSWFKAASIGLNLNLNTLSRYEIGMPSLRFNNFKLAKVRFRFQALIAAARLRWELQLLTGPSQDKTEASENSAS